MTQIVEALKPLLVEFGHDRIDRDTCIRLLYWLVSECIFCWNSDAGIRPYLPRILYYCTETDNTVFRNSETVVHLTCRRIVGAIEWREYQDKLSYAFNVIDQLNRVPLCYGIQARRGSRPDCFVPVIPAETVVDPNRKLFWRRFRTTVAQQKYVRIDVFSGDPIEDRTDRCTWIAGARIPLPARLRQDTRLTMFFRRRGQTALEASLRVDDENLMASDERIPVLTAPHGFHDLAELVKLERRRYHLAREAFGTEWAASCKCVLNSSANGRVCCRKGP